MFDLPAQGDHFELQGECEVFSLDHQVADYWGVLSRGLPDLNQL